MLLTRYHSAMIPTVYKIEFPDGKFYIGSSVNFPERRRTHLRHGARGKAVNPLLAEQFRTYPICAIYQIATGFNRETLHELEAQIMLLENPTLNLIVPTPLPAYYDGSAKPFGPYASIREASQRIPCCYGTLKRLHQKFTYEQVMDRLANGAPKKIQPRLKPPKTQGKIQT